MNYEPRNFSDLFDTPLGANLWEYLQRPALVFAMEVATKLHRPAIEAIGDDLIREFGNTVRQRRIKQLIGHMVRQILESRGYELEAQRVPVRFDDLCSTGSRYRRVQGNSSAPLEMSGTGRQPEEPAPQPVTERPLEPQRPRAPRSEPQVPRKATTRRPEKPGSQAAGWAAWGGTDLG